MSVGGVGLPTSALKKLRGYAYFLEFVGSNGPGWGPWFVAIVVAAAAVVLLAAEVLR